jgi:fructose-1,6-bisphosphatase/sedoheptulose 1,7-bisphosphatase-like protein
MSIVKLALKRKLISSAMIAAFAAGPFQAASCTVNVDEATVQALTDALNNIDLSGSTTIIVDGDDHRDGRRHGGGHHGDDD